MKVVTDPEQRRFVICQAARAFGQIKPKGERVPFDNPVSLDRSNMQWLKKEPYTVAFKADGIRYALVLCRYRGMRLACMVDRAGTVYSLAIFAAVPHFANVSVFDGELCACVTGSGYDFVVFDALMDKGALLHDKPYRVRLDHVKANFSGRPIPAGDRPKYRMYMYAKSPRLNLVYKEHDTAQNLRAMQRSVTPRYKYDGFVFTPTDRPVRPGRDEHSFKFKTENPIDAVYEVAWDRPARILVDDGGPLRPIEEILRVPVKFETSEEFEQIRADAEVYHSVFGGVFSYVVEFTCNLTKEGIILRFSRLRPDKDGPNNTVTIQRTVRTIQDNIRLEELYSVSAPTAAPSNFAHPPTIPASAPMTNG